VTLNLEAVRKQFPSLNRPAIFFDNPGGTQIAKDRGCKITWVDFDVEDGTLKVDEFQKAMEHKPKIVAFVYASNALGTVNPVRKLTKMAKEAGALVYIDAVQYAPHGPIDVQDIGCDFLVSSSYEYSKLQFTRDIQLYRPPGHRAGRKVTYWMQNPKWVMGYNQRLSPIFSSETIQ